MGQCSREIHAITATERDRGLLGDNAFAQRCQSHTQLDRRAWLRAAGESKLLIHHRQNASAGWLDRDHRAVHVSQGVDRSLTHNRILTTNYVAAGCILGDKRAHREPLVVTMAPAA